MESTDRYRFLPWVVALALLMEQLDTTIVNTAVPAMAASLGTQPLALRAVATSYIVSLAVTIPLAGWLADRFGTRRVFLGALVLFTLSSLACALAVNAPMLIAARVPQGMAAAMMMPVGRIAIVRSYSKSELLRAMNFVIIPALLGPLLGPTLGGVIVHGSWLESLRAANFAGLPWGGPEDAWRGIFLVNLPVGFAALLFGWRYMPDYRAATSRPLDWAGLALFGGGAALLTWVMEQFGETGLSLPAAAPPLLLAGALLAAYAWHAQRAPAPLLPLALLRERTFRIAVLGGFVTRLGVGGMPFLLPLLYQLGLGLPAWQSGLLMMPAAVAAMAMKALSVPLLRRWGYRRVLLGNTLLVAAAIGAFTLVGRGTPLSVIVLLGFVMGLGNSLQFSSMNSLAYADIADADASMAATLASTAQQLSLSFGLATGSLIAAWSLRDLPPGTADAVLTAVHHAFMALAVLTALSALVFRGLRASDGQSLSNAAVPAAAPGTAPARA